MTQLSGRGRPPSMADVGRLANVSAQTVSRYFTGGSLASETRQRVEDAIAKLGYRHNRLPNSLRNNRTNTIGYMSIGPMNHGSAGLLTGLSRAAIRSGQSLITSQLDLDPGDPSARGEVQHALDTFLSLRVDGIISGTPYLGLEAMVEFVADDVPVVALTERLGDLVDSLRADSYGAARSAVEHLASLGHRRILHVAGPDTTIEGTERQLGYLETLETLGLAPLPVLNAGNWTARGGAAAAEHADPTQFTAVFAANDNIALGFLSVMRERGVTCPDDFSIVGVDDVPDAAFYSPSLTTTRIDFQSMGERAFELLMERIETGDRPRHAVVETELVVRASTTPPHSP